MFTHPQIDAKNRSIDKINGADAVIASAFPISSIPVERARQPDSLQMSTESLLRIVIDNTFRSGISVSERIPDCSATFFISATAEAIILRPRNKT